MYSIGDNIIYGSMGVCTVQDICMPDIPGATKRCYLLTPIEGPQTRVWAPVEGLTVSMRPVMTKNEANELIDSLPNLIPFKPADKNEAQRTYKEALRSADGPMLATLIKTLHEKKADLAEKNRALPEMEKDVLFQAQQLLHGELAHILEIDMSEVPAHIEHKLAN